MRRYFAGVTAAAAHDIANVAAIPAGQTATLPLFAQWFKETFPRVEAVRGGKRQIEYDFGQTQALEHHNADFNELLDKLPTGSIVLLGQPTHIDHYLSSLSKALPAELTVDYDTPRKTVEFEDEHATLRVGVGYATLLEVQTAAIAAESMVTVSAAGRKLGLEQHWIDFSGRKTSARASSARSRWRTRHSHSPLPGL